MDGEPTKDSPPEESDRSLITGLGVVYLTVGMVAAVFVTLFAVAYFLWMP